MEHIANRDVDVRRQFVIAVDAGVTILGAIAQVADQRCGARWRARITYDRFDPIGFQRLQILRPLFIRWIHCQTPRATMRLRLTRASQLVAIAHTR